MSTKRDKGERVIMNLLVVPTGRQKSADDIKNGCLEYLLKAGEHWVGKSFGEIW